MSHFAKVENGIVTQVIVAEQDFIDSGKVGDPSLWIQTSYNTHAGVNNRPGGTALRKNYAGIGWTYDKGRDAFIPPKPYDSWILNEITCQWNSPIAKPDDGKSHDWDETRQVWVLRDTTGLIT